jgi:hypothetical protein
VVAAALGHSAPPPPPAAVNDTFSESDAEGGPPGWPPLAEAGSPEASKKLRDYAEVAYLTGRTRVVTRHFPTAMGIDDFLHRLEIALYAYGFNGDNAIGEVGGRARSRLARGRARGGQGRRNKAVVPRCGRRSLCASLPARLRTRSPAHPAPLPLPQPWSTCAATRSRSP